MKFIVLTIISIIVLIASAAYLSAGEDKEDIATRNNLLAFDLLPLLNNRNIFYSPYSISAALAMTYAGARGNTEKEMSETLYFLEDQDAFHPAFHKLNNEMEDRENEGIILNIANALWIDETARLLEDFLALTERYYEAAANRLDFIRESEKSRLEINRWVEEKTEERIRDILQPGDVTPDTRLILTNAIYFLGGWDAVFSKDLTEEGLFHVSPELEQKVPFMKREGRYKYYSDDEYQIVEIPYHERELAMCIVLPSQEILLSDVLERLDYDRFDKMVDSLVWEEVILEIPRFKFETRYNLKDIFRELGMIEPFTPAADFTGMTGENERFFIDEIIHQAFIEVEEEGTEAAAATAVVMRVTSLPPQPAILFRADRPFLFFIRDTITKKILFNGALYQP